MAATMGNTGEKRMIRRKLLTRLAMALDSLAGDLIIISARLSWWGRPPGID